MLLESLLSLEMFVEKFVEMFVETLSLEKLKTPPKMCSNQSRTSTNLKKNIRFAELRT